MYQGFLAHLSQSQDISGNLSSHLSQATPRSLSHPSPDFPKSPNSYSVAPACRGSLWLCLLIHALFAEKGNHFENFLPPPPPNLTLDINGKRPEKPCTCCTQLTPSPPRSFLPLLTLSRGLAAWILFLFNSALVCSYLTVRWCVLI
jgi:hypothetical protein